jgi:hypothetical protein
MKGLILVLAGAAVLASAPQATAANPCPPLLRLPPAAAAGEFTMYGHIKSLTHNGARFVLRFDPALWLTGVTASQASFEDTGSRDVANDYYVVDEGHRLLTFRVPANAHVTVLRHGTCTTQTTVAKLARSIPPDGFWIRVRIDTVRSLDQQYRP